MDNENYFVYVISSEVANKFYVGMSADPQIRLKQHNAGTVNSQRDFAPGNWCIPNLPETGEMPENLRSITRLELGVFAG